MRKASYVASVHTSHILCKYIHFKYLIFPEVMLVFLLQTRKLESSPSLQNPPVAWQTTRLRLFGLA